MMLKFFLLLAAFGCATSQRSQFVDYILDLQYAVGYIHDYIQDTTWKSRYAMSDELTLIVEGSVLEITNGLTSFLAIRDRSNNYVNEVRTEANAACVDAATANWTALQTAVGAVIGQCGGSQMETLFSNVNDYHTFVNSNRGLKFDAQNIVLNAFTEIETFTEVDNLSPNVEQGINAVYDRFEADVNPGIQERLTNFANLRTRIPNEVHDCIAVALNNFNSDAMLIVQAAQAC